MSDFLRTLVRHTTSVLPALTNHLLELNPAHKIMMVNGAVTLGWAIIAIYNIDGDFSNCTGSSGKRDETC